ncbi:MAG: hypothetical protein MJ126_08945 [Lachnospiraceae bacterium]|nr:hypothetical protein [Lachnospiraceae bacterium]
MEYNSYLSSSSVKETCRDYITYLTNENSAYEGLKEALNSFREKCAIEGDIKDAMDEKIGVVVTAIDILISANSSDITDANTLMDLVGDETYDGTVIKSQMPIYYNKWKDNNSNASSCEWNAINATDQSSKEYWKGQASNYRSIASTAWETYDFYYQKEKKYDEINAASAALFQTSSELRAQTANVLDAYKDSFPSGTFDVSKFGPYKIGKNELDGKTIEELQKYSNMSMEDILELIALQHAPAGSLPPAGQARLEELQAQLLESNPAAWDLYVNFSGDDNATTRAFMSLLTGAGYITSFVYTGGMSQTEALIEKLEVLEAIVAQDPNGPNSGYYKEQIAIIEGNLKNYCDNSLANAEHSEEFKAAYDYMMQSGDYSMAELAAIVLYWETVDGGDITGKEMPPEWCQEHLVLPDNLQITEENCTNMASSSDLQNWYGDGFYIVELMSGQPDADGGRISISEGRATDAFLGWYTYTYGGMIDFVLNEPSVRATKYAFEKYIFPFADYSTQDYYHANTNEVDTMYLFSIEAYIAQSGRTDKYYEGLIGSKVNREKQLLIYLNEDVANGNIKSITDYTEEEILLFMIEYDSTSASDYGCPDFMSMDSLANLLEHELEGTGERSYRIEGNTLYITFKGGEDIYGNTYPRQELAFTFDTAIDAFGKKYITLQEFRNVAAEVAVKQVEGGFYMSDYARDELYKDAVAILCQTGGFTEDQLASLPADELNQLIISTEEILLANGMIERFQDGRMRVVDGVYQSGKEVSESVANLLKFASFLCPGIGAITIASEVTTIGQVGWDAMFGEADMSSLKDIAMALINMGAEVHDGESLGKVLSAISSGELSMESLKTIYDNIDFENGSVEINKDTVTAFKDLLMVAAGVGEDKYEGELLGDALGGVGSLDGLADNAIYYTNKQ